MTREEAKKELNRLKSMESQGYVYIGTGFLASGEASPGQAAMHYERKKELEELTNKE